MDITSLKFDITDKEQYIKDCYAVLEIAEPYEESVFTNIEYDGNSKLDDERVIATLAKHYLIEHGYKI